MLKVTQAEYASDGHVVLTGPTTASFVLEDGTVVNASDPVVEVASPEHAAELAHLIGLHYAKNGHPNVKGTFEYDPPKKFAKYVPHADNGLEG